LGVLASPAVAAVLLSTSEALAATDGVAYNNAAGEDFIKNVAGTAYVILVGFFLYRVLTRRAKRAKEQVVHEDGMQFALLLPLETTTHNEPFPVPFRG
jgi:hypothetical protein